MSFINCVNKLIFKDVLFKKPYTKLHENPKFDLIYSIFIYLFKKILKKSIKMYLFKLR